MDRLLLSDRDDEDRQKIGRQDLRLLMCVLAERASGVNDIAYCG